jgi:hypothetical protein
MRNFPTDPMAQHNLFIAALCEDWREAGTVTRDTPRANAVAEITRQVNAGEEIAELNEMCAAKEALPELDPNSNGQWL